MYVSLLRLYAEVAENPLIYVGLVILLMASWGLIVGVITEIAIVLFDVRSDGRSDGRESASPRGQR